MRSSTGILKPSVLPEAVGVVIITFFPLSDKSETARA
jgi:hypothetical protein